MAKRRLSIWRLFLLLTLLAALVAAGGTASFVLGAIRTMPKVHEIEPRPDVTSCVYDVHGELVAELHEAENRIPVKLADMPKHLINAFIATEDHLFYQHRGVSIRAILGAIWANLTGGKVVRGGSTITQQLARSAFLTMETSLRRKVQEAILAVQLERRYTKDEILEFYLNQIFFGHNAYGVQAAARFYFAKDVGNLTLAEAALLAGITRSPNAYSPYNNMRAAKARQEVVLGVMEKHGFITRQEAEQALAEEIKLVPEPPTSTRRAPHFVDYVLKQLLDRYGPETVYKGGLRVYTTLDLRIQEAAEQAMRSVLDPVYPPTAGPDGTVQPQAAVVVLEPQTGYIKAMIGGRTYSRLRELNRAAQTTRSPGSAFKPIAVYTAALANGMTPASVVDDAPIEYPVPGGEIWAPENYTEDYSGLTTVRRALELSINVPAVRVMEAIGVQTGVETIKKMGITTLVTQGKINDSNLSVALGGLTQGVSLLELTGAYAVLGNQGVYAEPMSILRVVNAKGTVLEENFPKKRAVIDPRVAYLMTDMMRGVIERGTGWRAKIGRPAAGKTGTTTDDVDAWFIGYTPELACGVWLGHDQPKDMGGVYGGRYPAQIWALVMKEALRDSPPTNFVKPNGITDPIPVCNKSGLLPGPNCPSECVISEIFIVGTEPTTTCDVHVVAEVCAENQTQLATVFCPHRVSKVFIRRREPYTPAADGRVPLDSGQELPKEYCTLHSPFAPPPTSTGSPLPAPNTGSD